MTSNPNAIEILTPQELMATDQTRRIENITAKLMKLAHGASRLTAAQASELAVFSLITGANAFNHECYHMGYHGITFGVEWYKRKGAEQLYKDLGHQQGQIFYDVKPATHADAMFDEEKGDIAKTVTITDTASKGRWQNEWTNTFLMFKREGLDADTAREQTNMMHGSSPPTWSASAVVYGSETFGDKYTQNDKKDGKIPEGAKVGDMKEQAWDRNERAEKRATKWALKKRFPNVDFGDKNGDDVLVLDGIAREVAERVAGQMEAEANREPRSIDENLTALGFEPRGGSIATNKMKADATVVSRSDRDVVKVLTREDVEDAEAYRMAEGDVEEEEPVSRPYTPELLKERIREYQQIVGVKEWNEVQRKILAKHLRIVFDKDDTKRYEFCNWLVGEPSTTNMNKSAVQALLHGWLGVHDWNDVILAEAIEEAKTALPFALKEAGQIEMEL